MNRDSNWTREEVIFPDVSLNLHHNNSIQKGSTILENICFEFCST